MKELRAVVLGVVVVLVVAMMLAFWNRPAKEFTRTCCRQCSGLSNVRPNPGNLADWGWDFRS